MSPVILDSLSWYRNLSVVKLFVAGDKFLRPFEGSSRPINRLYRIMCLHLYILSKVWNTVFLQKLTSNTNFVCFIFLLNDCLVSEVPLPELFQRAYQTYCPLTLIFRNKIMIVWSSEMECEWMLWNVDGMERGSMLWSIESK